MALRVKRKTIFIHSHDKLLRVLDEARAALAWVAGRKPVQGKMDQEYHPPFFIIGSGRSGNTLLRAMLMRNHDVSIPPESYVLGDVIRRYRTTSYLPWPELVPALMGHFDQHPEFTAWDIDLCECVRKLIRLEAEKHNLADMLDALYRYYAEKHRPGATRWGDKTPLNTYHLVKIDRVFPHAKYIHLIRDGRDVVSSYVRAGIYADVEDAAVRWRSSIRLGRSFGLKKGEAQYLEIRYESLVTNTAYTLRTICDFLDLAFQEEMLQPEAEFEHLGDTALAHHAGLRKPINRDSIGKWKTELDEEQRTKIRVQLKDDLKKLHYE